MTKMLKGFRELYKMFTEMWWVWAAIMVFSALVAGTTYLVVVYVLGVK